jgi:AAA family ATPase
MALMRPGRLDRLVYVGLPDEQGRREILKIRMKGMSIAPEVDIDELVAMVRCTQSHRSSISKLTMGNQTEGCSGAEIGALCTEAAMLTMQQNIDAPHVSSRVVESNENLTHGFVT